MKNISVLIITLMLLSGGVATGQVASGGGFTLQQSVLASGGGTSAGGAFTIETTSGQPAAGTRSNGSAFNLHGGFRNAAPLAPTAAGVRIAGRVTTADGRGIRNAHVTLTDAGGASRTVITGSFGYYLFDEIEAGQIVIIVVRAKRFTFARPAVALSVSEDTDEIDFVAVN